MLPDVTWTPNRIDRLKALAQQGLSCSQIAGELGGVTRNAVIGKLGRLGITKAPTHRAPRPPREPEQPRLRLRRAIIEPKTRARTRPVADTPPPATVISLRVALVNLTEWHCRWPLGDPRAEDFAYCGLPRVDTIVLGERVPHPNCSYCNFHKHKARA